MSSPDQKLEWSFHFLNGNLNDSDKISLKLWAKYFFLRKEKLSNKSNKKIIIPKNNLGMACNTQRKPDTHENKSL